ncbi:hypothetical protein Mapa_013944 [Marchantia paleacea]|nr:hypothetical protein Mapa_013944 [Marchantia paleacea]
MLQACHLSFSFCQIHPPYHLARMEEALPLCLDRLSYKHLEVGGSVDTPAESHYWHTALLARTLSAGSVPLAPVLPSLQSSLSSSSTPIQSRTDQTEQVQPETVP